MPSHSITVRPAVPKDAPVILEIERSCAEAAHWKLAEYERAILEPERLVLVAEQDSSPAAFVVAFTATDEWELENIAVAPAYRRRGLGRALMLELVARARRAGAIEIRQEIRASNIAAQRLGQSVGFVHEGRRRNYYQDPVEDALLFKHLVAKQRAGNPGGEKTPS